jgi:hypothetical protein
MASEPMSDDRKFRIGDQVRPADSSIADLGEVIQLRDQDYVVVHWYGSNRSTHHRRSLEIAGNGQRSVPDLEAAPASP